MNEQTVSADIMKKYPPIDEKKADILLKKEMEANGAKIVVLDDDPTGVQTVHDISVYTDWSRESIEQGFREKNRLFYILTNSRGFTVDQTTEAHKEIACNIAETAERLGIRYMVMSRSDSTLRGHYPLETRLLKQALEAHGSPVLDGEILCPFFREGGRFTIGNVHYVKYGDELVPAGNTEFAQDRTFGYQSSDLREYVEEKTDGEYPAAEVVCITLESLRGMGIDEITNQLMAVKNFNKVVVNAMDYCDLKVFGIALYRAIARGKHFLFRTAAGLVKIMGGISDQPLLTRNDLVVNETKNGGIVVVGSHTSRTTAQLEKLLTLDCVEAVEFHSNLVLEGDEVFYREVDRVVARSEEIIRSGKTAVCFTSRKPLTLEQDSKEDALVRSVKISDGVQSLVGRLKITPAFVVAKGGITSSDVGTRALQVKRAKVMGQIRPGIPVWQTGGESTFPKIPYVIFPGNVGEAETLKEVVEILTGI